MVNNTYEVYPAKWQRVFTSDKFMELSIVSVTCNINIWDQY